MTWPAYLWLTSAALLCACLSAAFAPAFGNDPLDMWWRGLAIGALGNGFLLALRGGLR